MHHEDGFHFERGKDGDVILLMTTEKKWGKSVETRNIVHTIPADEWASILAFLRVAKEAPNYQWNAEALLQARDFHLGKRTS